MQVSRTSVIFQTTLRNRLASISSAFVSPSWIVQPKNSRISHPSRLLSSSSFPVEREKTSMKIDAQSMPIGASARALSSSPAMIVYYLSIYHEKQIIIFFSFLFFSSSFFSWLDNRYTVYPSQHKLCVCVDRVIFLGYYICGSYLFFYSAGCAFSSG